MFSLNFVYSFNLFYEERALTIPVMVVSQMVRIQSNLGGRPSSFRKILVLGPTRAYEIWRLKSQPMYYNCTLLTKLPLKRSFSFSKAVKTFNPWRKPTHLRCRLLSAQRILRTCSPFSSMLWATHEKETWLQWYKSEFSSMLRDVFKRSVTWRCTSPQESPSARFWWAFNWHNRWIRLLRLSSHQSLEGRRHSFCTYQSKHCNRPNFERHGTFCPLLQNTSSKLFALLITFEVYWNILLQRMFNEIYRS